MRDSILLKDFNTTITVRDSDGKIKKLWNPNVIGKKLCKLRIPYLTGTFGDCLTNHNLITSAGISAVAKLIGNISSPVSFSYVALGTGTTAAAAGDTTLQTEITTGGLGRAVATITNTTTTTTNDAVTFVRTFTASSSFSVTEAGILSAASAGVLLAHQVFTAIALSSGDSIQITWVVTA